MESDPQRREWLQAQYPDLSLYTQIEPALAADANALVIATLAPSHYDLAKAALEAGKDCFVEKPMTLRVEEAKDLAQEAEGAGAESSLELE